MQVKLNTTKRLNWLDFRVNLLFLSYCVIWSPWRPLTAIQIPVKSKLPTTNYLTLWKVHLFYKVDNNPSEILRTNVSKLSSVSPASYCVEQVCPCINIWHTPRLFTCSLYCVCTLSCVCIRFLHKALFTVSGYNFHLKYIIWYPLPFLISTDWYRNCSGTARNRDVAVSTGWRDSTYDSERVSVCVCVCSYMYRMSNIFPLLLFLLLLFLILFSSLK